MSNFTFNVAKGKVNYFATLPAANDALIAVPLLTANLEGDETLKDKTTLAAILASSSDEQTTLGRVSLTGATVTTDNVNNTNSADVADFTFTSAGGSPIAAIIICYVPDTTAGGLTAGAYDSSVIPLTKHDFSAIPNGTDLPVQVSSFGFFVAADDD